MGRKLTGEDDEQTARGIHLSFITGLIFIAAWCFMLVHYGEKNSKCFTNDSGKIECKIGG